MIESSGYLNVSPHLNKRIKEQRKIAGLPIEDIDKDGSRLQFLRNPEGQVDVVRNSEISIPSMAVWEFLDSYAHTLFPPEIREKIFGPEGQAHIAPILKKNGKNRVYYGERMARAYSKYVGLNTEDLASLWNMKGLFFQYYFHESFSEEKERWLDSIAYHLLSDVVHDNPSLDPDHLLIHTLESWWSEFSRLNSRLFANRMHYIRHKELSRADMDGDLSYLSSLQLIQLDRTITDQLVKVYHMLEKQEETVFWKETPLTTILLFLIHSYQASTQQMILWWLGISHKHLHLNNCVSQANTKDAIYSGQSPLVTTIIDFDAARIDEKKILNTPELLQNVDQLKAKELFHDESLNPSLRILFLFYVQIEDWDDTMLRFFSDTSSPVKDRLIHLLSKRLEHSESFSSQEKFDHFLEFIYIYEQQKNHHNFQRFPLTMTILSHNQQYSINIANLQIISEYFHLHSHAIRRVKTGSKDQQILMLEAMQYRIFGNPMKYSLVAEPSVEELQYMIEFLEKDGEVKEYSLAILQYIIEDFSNQTIQKLFIEGKKGNSTQEQLAKTLSRFIFSQRFPTAQRQFDTKFYFVNKLLQAEIFEDALEIINFHSLPKNTAKEIYQNLRSKIFQKFQLKNSKSHSHELSRLDAIATEIFGSAFVLSEIFRENLQHKREQIKRKMKH